MPQIPNAPERTSSAARRPLLVPPEERFWRRYSPHHELPLSGATSATLHIVALGLLLLVALVLFDNRSRSNTDVPPMDVVSEPSGAPACKAKAKTSGIAGAPRGRAAPENGEDVPDQKNNPAEREGKPLPNRRLKNPVEPAPAKPNLPALEGQRPFFPGDLPAQLDEVGKRASQALSQKPDNSRRAGGSKDKPGKNGTGQGARRGKPDGKGIQRGAFEQERRARRQLRWRVIFTTQSGSDYQDQLHALGAVLVVAEPEIGPGGKPVPDGRGSVKLVYRKVIRDLSKSPAPVRNEDVHKINGIFWIDDKPASVAALAKALGLRGSPPLFAAFFPPKVEHRLRELEKSKFGGHESRIDETVFRVVAKRDGKYRGTRARYQLICESVHLIPR